MPQIPEEQAAFQEVDLGERKPRSYYRSADKENVPPQNSHHGLKRLMVSPGVNESTVSIARIPKVCVVQCIRVVLWTFMYPIDISSPDAPFAISQEVIGTTDPGCYHYA